MATKEFTNITEQLQGKEKELFGSSSLGGPSLLSYPLYNNANRLIMFNSNLNQRVVLEHSEFARVFGNFENIVGEYSSYNKQAKSNYEVIDIVEKFPNIETGCNVRTMQYFVFDLDRNMYDVIRVSDVENLGEKYGFQNDTSGIRKYGIGDKIKKGEPLIRPTSYDDYDNYGFGQNIRFMYTCDLDTIEDGIVVSESLRKRMLSSEVEIVTVPINDNDFLLNMYGDNENYKTFPDIGEKTNKKIVCVKRRINNSQILYDMARSNTQRIMSSDTPYYCDGEVVDIDIYCNKPIDELVQSQFNHQLIEYIEMTNAYYERIKTITQELIETDIPCSQNILSLAKRAKELTDPNIIIKDESGSEFSNIKVYFTIKRKVGVSKGQKLTGRHGNKGVVGTVKPDYLMPHLETGERVDILFNALGVYNRINIFQLFEQTITFITDRIVNRMKEPDMTLSDREDMFFKILDIFNPEQCIKFKEIYGQYRTKREKEEFFNIVMDKGIYIHIKPYWHPVNLYDAALKAYKEFPWIKPYKTYFYEENSKRWVPMMNDQVVGSMYVMKLKQDSKKQLSVCANAPINNIGVPVKTDGAKKHRSLHSKTPIRSGLQETINNMISVDPRISAKLHLFYRSSPVARPVMGKMIIENYGKGKPIEPVITDKMTNRNVEILSAYLRCMGYELEFQKDEFYIPRKGDNTDSKYYRHQYKGNTYIGTSNFMVEQIAHDTVTERMKDNEIGYIYVGGEGKIKERLIHELADTIRDDIIENGSDWFRES